MAIRDDGSVEAVVAAVANSPVGICHGLCHFVRAEASMLVLGSGSVGFWTGEIQSKGLRHNLN